MTKIGRFLRGFSVVDFSAIGFVEILKILKTQRPKSLFLFKSDFHWQSNAFLWFDFQIHGFTYQGRNASQQCSAALRKAKIFLQREVYLFARCLIKLIAETHVYICHKNMKSMSIFFLQFLESFQEKKYKKQSTGNEEPGLSLRQH